MGQHDPVGVALRAERGDGGDALLGGVEQVEPEAVAPDGGSAVHHLAQVVEVVGVPGVPDDDLGQVDPVGLVQVEGEPAGLVGRVGVHGDRDAGLDVGGRDGVLDARLVGGQAPLLDDALEERRLDPGAADPLADVLEEHLHHRLVPAEQGVRAAVVQVVRELVEGVEPGRDDDVEVDLGVDPGDARTYRPSPTTVGSTIVVTPSSRRRRSLVIASATRTSSSQYSSP